MIHLSLHAGSDRECALQLLTTFRSSIAPNSRQLDPFCELSDTSIHCKHVLMCYMRLHSWLCSKGKGTLQSQVPK